MLAHACSRLMTSHHPRQRHWAGEHGWHFNAFLKFDALKSKNVEFIQAMIPHPLKINPCMVTPAAPIACLVGPYSCRCSPLGRCVKGNLCILAGKAAQLRSNQKTVADKIYRAESDSGQHNQSWLSRQQGVPYTD